LQNHHIIKSAPFNYPWTGYPGCGLTVLEI